MKSINKNWAVLIIIVLSSVIYLNILSNGFVYDDHTQVLKNPWITDISHLGDIFSSSVWDFDSASNIEAANYYYRPMLHVAYMATYSIFGLAPWGFHLVNLMLHIINAVLVFYLAGLILTILETGGVGRAEHGWSMALLASLVFAMHPINTEVVSWVASITDLLFTCFFLLSLYLYIYERLNSTPRRKYLRLLSLLSFSLALLSKETALLLPVVLVIFDYDLGSGIKSLRPKAYLQYVFVFVLYFLLRGYAIGVRPTHELFLGAPIMQALNTAPVLMLYFSKLLLPIKLSPFYVYTPNLSILEPRLLLSIIGLTIIAVFIWIKRRDAPGLLSGFALLIVPLLPTFYLLFNDPAIDHISLPSDRYLYLSSVGFSILFVLVLCWISNRLKTQSSQRLLTVALLILLVIYGAGVVKRTFAWRDDRTLWEATIRDYPENYYAHYALSGLYMDEGRLPLALREIKESVRIRPVYAGARHRLGLLYYLTGDKARAREAFEIVLKTNPDNGDVHYNLGVIYLENRVWSQAVSHLKRALDIIKDRQRGLKIRNLLAVSLAGMGDNEGARRELKEVLRIDPNDTQAAGNMRYLKRLY